MCQNTLPLVLKTFSLMNWRTGDVISQCREQLSCQSCERTTPLAATGRPTASTEVVMETRVAVAMAVRMAMETVEEAMDTVSNSVEAGDLELRVKIMAAVVRDHLEDEITRARSLLEASVTQIGSKWSLSSSRPDAASPETSECFSMILAGPREPHLSTLLIPRTSTRHSDAMAERLAQAAEGSV